MGINPDGRSRKNAACQTTSILYENILVPEPQRTQWVSTCSKSRKLIER